MNYLKKSVTKFSAYVAFLYIAQKGAEYYYRHKYPDEIDPELQKKVNKIAKKMNIDPPQCFSADYSGVNNKMILLEKDAIDFTIAHELIHYKEKHTMWNVLTVVTCISFLNFNPLLNLTLTLGADRIIGYICEKKADLHALEYLDKDQIVEGIHRFMDLDFVDNLNCNSLPMYTRIYRNISTFVDVHPNFSKRIEYLMDYYYKLPIDPIKWNSQELSIQESSKILNNIRSSRKDKILIGLKEVNVGIDSVTCISGANITRYKIQNISTISSHDDVLQKIFTHPHFVHLSIDCKDPIEGAVAFQTNLVPNLSKNFTKYNWENITYQTNDDSLKIYVEEKH